ncbi:tyrosine-protein phosphatase [Microbacterium soli]
MPVLSVPGVNNLRDVGGIPAGDTRVRSGALLRSGHLSGVTAEGRSVLSGLVRHIVDLRDDAEVRSAPSDLTAVDTTRVPLFLGSADSFLAQGMDLAAMYRHLVDESGERFVEAIRVIARGEPTLVHCTLGKDRTGVTVALALSAVGADRDAVIADYALTQSQLSASRKRSIERYLRAISANPHNAIQVATASPAAVMAALLDDIDERFGSAAGYLETSGLTDAELAALRDALLV